MSDNPSSGPARPPLVAIEDITFDLEAGSLVTLLGPSGCGKTTFLKIVGGLIAGIERNRPDQWPRRCRAAAGFRRRVPAGQPDAVADDHSPMFCFPMEILHRADAAATTWHGRIARARSGSKISRSPTRRSFPAACSSGSRFAAL